MTLPKTRSSWSWIDKGIRYAENVLAICLLTAIIIDILLAVFFRYVLSNPLSWSGEVATYMFAWLTLLGMAIAQRDHGHIEVRLFSHLSDKAGIATAWISWIASAIFFVVLAVAGYLFTLGDTIEIGAASGLPVWVAYACLPVGAALGLYHTVCDLPALIRSPLTLGSVDLPKEDITA
jgi:TRAP-type C4-dicarboxylate transport system permease small subunit